MPAKSIPIVIRVSSELHSAIREEAMRLDRSMAWVMRDALKNYLQRSKECST